MDHLCNDKSVLIRKGLPVAECGLTFYPVTMEHYERFLACKDALCLRQSSLPVRYIAMDFTSALFALEMDAIIAEKSESSGAFYRFLQLLYLSLRLDIRTAELDKSILVSQKGDNVRLEGLIVKQNESEVTLTPQQISSFIRPLIARQNGLELPNESYNNELVEAEAIKKELTASDVQLDPNVDSLIDTVAYKSGLRRGDVLEWTVAEFELRRRTIDRDVKYIIFTQAEMSGMVKFKKGNPVPSMFFDVKDDTLGSAKVSDLGLEHLTEKTQ